MVTCLKSLIREPDVVKNVMEKVVRMSKSARLAKAKDE